MTPQREEAARLLGLARRDHAALQAAELGYALRLAENVAGAVRFELVQTDA